MIALSQMLASLDWAKPTVSNDANHTAAASAARVPMTNIISGTVMDRFFMVISCIAPLQEICG